MGMENILSLKPNIIIGDLKEGTLTLNAWIGFQSRQGPYGSKDSNDQSDGTVKVTVSGCQVDYVKVCSQAQINAIKFLADNSEKIRDEIIKELVVAFPDMKAVYNDHLPDISSIDEFKNYIGLSIVHIMTSEKDSLAYVGFEFGCTWDEEHGLGVMTHKNRVVSLGQADKSFDIWSTYRDNGTINQMIEKWNNDHKHLKKQKPWWKLW